MPEAKPSADAASLDALSIEQEVKRANLKSLYANLPFSTASSLCAAVLLLVGLWQKSDHTFLLAWLFINTLLIIVRILLYFRFKKAENIRYSSWNTAYILTLFCSGILWGWAGGYFYPSDSLFHQAYVLFVLGGIVLGAIAVNMATFVGTTLYTSAVLLPVCLRCLAQGTMVNLTMVGMIAVFWILMTLVSKKLNAIINTSFELRFRNVGLIQHLTREQKKSSQLVESLTNEIRVRKIMEKELRQSESKFRTLTETVSSGIFIFQDARVKYANQAAESILGYSKEELMAKPALDFVDPEHRNWVDEVTRSSMEDPKEPPDRHVFRMIGRDGGDIWVEYTNSPMEYEGRPALLGTIFDITQRKEAQQALEDSEMRYRLMFDFSPVSIWEEDFSDIKIAVDDLLAQGVTDIENYLYDHRDIAWSLMRKIKVLNVNPAGLDLFEAKDEEELLMNFGNIMREETLDSFIKAVANLSEGNQTTNIEDSLQTLKGDKINVHTGFRLLTRDTSDWSRMLIVLSDITDLTMARQQAEAANQTKSLFLANMSHDLRTPMNGLMGMLQLLQSEPLEPEQKNFVDMGIYSCKRLIRLLSDILDLSKIEAGKMPLATQPFRIREVLHNIKELLSIVAEEENVQLSFKCADEVPDMLIGDEHRIEQVLVNLVGNAIKFSRNSEVVTEVSVTHHIGDRLVLLCSVADSGIGIADEYIADLFDMFTQANTTSARKGSGLGLAIVKRLVLLMDGGICVKSELGVGTTFFAHIRLGIPAISEVGDEALAEDSANSPLPPFKALIIEDDAINRQVISGMLKNLGGEVDQADSGQDGLELLKVGRYDVVLMDIQLPGMDGVEVAERIRSDLKAEAAGVPIIAMTAYAMAGDRDKFLAAGMDGYLAKPLEKNVLRKVLRQMLRHEEPS